MKKKPFNVGISRNGLQRQRPHQQPLRYSGYYIQKHYYDVTHGLPNDKYRYLSLCKAKAIAETIICYMHFTINNDLS